MRVLLADNQRQVRSALLTLLKRQPDMEVIGEVSEANSLLVQVQAIKPDLVLLDWGLPSLTAIGSLPALRTHCPELRVIVLSGRPEARREALAAGADAFVSKIEPPERLLAALQAMNTRGSSSRL